jgi:asparagine synthase (glutamine-hydrolysing)
MCGIAGVLRVDGGAVEADELRGAAAMLAHRGPDGEGIFTDGPVGLAHRRLAVLDLTDTGRQPMTDAEGRYSIVFNGEIYNFLELRDELAGAGHCFRSDGDTEVILAAYRQWGEDCLFRFNGMWAFALWDAAERRLFLARDRFGVKPLHWRLDQTRFAFTSELKGFLGFSWFNPAFDPGMIALALSNPAIIDAVAPCILTGVQTLRAGHCLSVGPDGAPRLRRWWNTLDHIPTLTGGPDAWAEELKELLFDACDLRMRSDAPVATALSGGLDSSAVHGAMAHIGLTRPGRGRRPENRLRAYVAAFPGTAQDETAYAEAMIAKAGSSGVRVVIDGNEIAEHADDIIFAQEAVCDSPVSTWLLYRAMARDGVKVSLDGHGGDELFVGYFSQLHDAQFRTFDPAQRRLFAETKAAMVVPGSMPGSEGRRAFRHVLRRPSDVVFPERAGDEAALERFDPLSRRLYMDFHYATLPNILANFDRTTMAHGVESRAPLLDWRLVCFAFALPWTVKVADGMTKAILRRAAGDLLPDVIARRTGKLGFVSPLRDWAAGPLRAFMLDTTASTDFLQSDWWDGPALAGEAQDAARRNDAAGLAALWPFVQTSRLQALFRERAAHHRSPSA